MAAKAIRRGAVRMRSSLGSGHTSLNIVISDLSTVRRRLKDSTAAQHAATLSQLKWSQEERSPVLQDIVHQMNEISLMWLEAQKQYIATMKEYKRLFEHIVETEKKLDQARKALSSWEEKERKYEKEIVKGAGKDMSIVQDKLQYAKDKKQLAMAEVEGQQRETEAIKLMSLKSGLLDHSREWHELGKKCCVFAEAQKELALLIPDVSIQETTPTYTGVRQSMQILRDVRQALASAAPAYGSSTDGSISLALSPTSAQTPFKNTPSYFEDANDSFDSFDSDN